MSLVQNIFSFSHFPDCPTHEIETHPVFESLGRPKNPITAFLMCLLDSDDPRTSWSFLVRGEFWMWEMELQITRLMGPSVLHTDAHASETHVQTNTFASYQVYFFHLSIIKHLSSFWHNIRK